jgi:hypothetical protein
MAEWERLRSRIDEQRSQRDAAPRAGLEALRARHAEWERLRARMENPGDQAH